mgnify:CR=1 FL=1
MSLSVFSLVTADAVDERGHLGEFRVGGYPKKRLRNLAIYDPPPGFIRVDERTREKKVSPNFRLGQFLCKQVGGYPKYLALDPALLVKLEKILAALNAAGRRTDSLHVMSGYRTPWYNAAIGNVKYSRHLWGGAADIFVDADPRDGVMDDLNRDGVVNREDAVWLAGFIDEMASSGQFETPGGIGSYGSTSAHGPFVHVDVRGYRARW